MLGTDLGNGIDLLCSMMKSAVTLNQQKSLKMISTFIRLILNERIYLSNVINVLIDRCSIINGSNYDSNRLAREALDQSKNDDVIDDLDLDNIQLMLKLRRLFYYQFIHLESVTANKDVLLLLIISSI